MTDGLVERLEGGALPTQILDFAQFGIRVELPPGRYIRADGVVSDLESHVMALREQMKPRAPHFNWDKPPVLRSAMVPVMLTRDRRVAIIVVAEQGDMRLNESLMAHEQYHALEWLHPVAVDQFWTQVIQRVDVQVPWRQLDEEDRAIAIELFSLNLDGVMWSQLDGAERMMCMRDQIVRWSRAPADRGDSASRVREPQQ